MPSTACYRRLRPGPPTLAKHKVAGSTPVTRSQEVRGLAVYYSRSLLRDPLAALDRDLGRFVVVELSVKVAKRAGDLAPRRTLRGFDAIHHAGTLEMEALTGAAPRFGCFDDRLRAAAVAEGLPV